MAVRITKPSFNLREKISELDRPVGSIGTQILKTNTLTEFARAAHTGRRNFIRNGAMEVWQRGTSAFNNVYDYTADRWQATRYAGTVNQITRNEINDRMADEYGFNWYLRYGFSTGGGGSAYLNQPLESADSKKLRGKPVCFSFYAKTSSHHAGKQFRSCISYHTDTNYNDNGMYYFGFKNPTTTIKSKGYHHIHELWQRYWVTVTIPFDAEQVGVGLIEADYDNGSIDITGCQLEIGNSPTPFEHLSYGEELHLCRRYYYNLNNAVGGQVRFVGYGGGGTSAGFSLQHRPPMRVTPTGTVTANTLSYNDGIAAYSGNNGGGGWSFNGNRFGCDINTTTNAANTAIRGKALSIYSGGTGTSITLNAEL